MNFQTAHDFFDIHGILFLVFITIFPRLTLLFSSVPTGGILWWLGFFIAPRILVAFLATMTYGATNPILVAISWIVALSGESGEKYFMRRRVRYVRYGGGRAGGNAKEKDVIEPDYQRLN